MLQQSAKALLHQFAGLKTGNEEVFLPEYDEEDGGGDAKLDSGNEDDNDDKESNNPFDGLSKDEQAELLSDTAFAHAILQKVCPSDLFSSIY